MDQTEQEFFSADAHIGVTCDGCSSANFVGLRHKCLVCFDYDLCHDCALAGVTSKQHLNAHQMQSIMPPHGGDYDVFFGAGGSGSYDDMGEGDLTDDARATSDANVHDGNGNLFDNGGSGSFVSDPLTAPLFKCPYCEEDAFSEMQLVNHVNDVHPTDAKPVVCPICAIAPGGDPNYISRNFQGHLELRHLRLDTDRPKRASTRKPTFSSSLFGLDPGSADQQLDPRHLVPAASNDSMTELFTHLSGRKKSSKEVVYSTTKGGNKISMSTIRGLGNSSVSQQAKPPPSLLSICSEPALPDDLKRSIRNRKIVKSVFLKELLLSTLTQNKEL